MRAGGTTRGMVDMMKEFSVSVIGICVMMATAEPSKKRIDGVRSLLMLENIDDASGIANIRPSNWMQSLRNQKGQN